VTKQELERVDYVCRRPLFYMIGDSLAETMAFIGGYANGIAVATGRDPLEGFSPWIAARFGYAKNWAWMGVIAKEYADKPASEARAALVALITELASSCSESKRS
jgi:hypothetical protein